MPELPDITVYLEALERLTLWQRLEGVRIASPFLLRSVDPPLSAVEGRRVVRFRRIGKRIGIGLEGDLWLVLHLMIAGRLQWRSSGAKIPARRGLAAFDLETGTLLLTEAGSKKKASLFVVSNEEALAEHEPGGIEPLEVDLETFREALTRNNHTLKRALTDPKLLSGIGNAYSDEILHRARLSPIRWSRRLDSDELARLYEATRDTLTDWIERLRLETGDGFPNKVTAFREGMTVHGRFGEPCPDCGSPIQRIRYVSSETNYCPECQTDGKVLADRALSRLLGRDWPRSLEELEQIKSG
jgi:formamidopyrimidine-DNA glycosylase